MDTVVYRATSTADLGHPLGLALANAARDKRQAFHVILTSGMYELRELSLREGIDIAIRLECDGETPATVKGTNVDLEGHTVEVRNLVIQPRRSDIAALRIRVRNAATVERVAILSADVGAKDVNSSVLEIASRPMVRPPDPVPPARATLRDVWIVGSKVQGQSGAAVLGFPDRGRGYFDHIEIERLVLANNTAPAGIDVEFASSVTLRDIIVIEPDLKVPWLRVRDPDAQIRMDGGFIAVDASVIGTKANLPEITVHNVEFRGAAPDERIAQATNTFGPRLRPIRDWSFVLTAARAAAIPDRAALTASLR